MSESARGQGTKAGGKEERKEGNERKEKNRKEKGRKLQQESVKERFKTLT